MIFSNESSEAFSMCKNLLQQQEIDEIKQNKLKKLFHWSLQSSDIFFISEQLRKNFENFELPAQPPLPE